MALDDSSVVCRPQAAAPGSLWEMQIVGPPQTYGTRMCGTGTPVMLSWRSTALEAGVSGPWWISQ